MRIQWDTGPRPYAQGVKMGVLYQDEGPGVAWNGLISVTDSVEQTQDANYFDGVRYSTRATSLPASGVISAFTYPDELEGYIGTLDFFTAQPNRPFSFCYRTNTEIHIIYEAMLTPTPREFTSISADYDPVSFQWAFTTQPQKIPGGKPSAHIVILVDDVPPDILVAIENALYGDDEDDPRILMPDDIEAIYQFTATLTITDNGDGTWSADGPDDVVTLLPGDKFQIDSPTLTYVDTETYFVSTY